MIKRYGETDFVTGLRAIAATMVVVIHTGAFAEFGWIGNNITNAGKAGVYAFFVIAGFSVTQSFSSSAGFRPYILRRLLRIAPPYFAVVLITFTLISLQVVPIPFWGAQFGASYDFYNLFMHLTFLSFLDYRVANSILSVEWTLPIELFWYFLLPLFLLSSKRWLAALVGLVFAIVMTELTRPVLSFWGADAPKMMAHWLPMSYGTYFFLGVLAARYRSDFLHLRPNLDKGLLYLGLAIFIAATVLGIGNADRLVAVATFLIVSGYGKPHAAVRASLVNTPLLFVGAISYGIYLVHFPIIYVLSATTDWERGFNGFLIVYAFALILATAIYFLIEQPANRLGKSWAKAVTVQARVGSG